MKISKKLVAGLSAVGLVGGMGGIAQADAPTDGSIAIQGTSNDDAYTNTLAVSIDAAALHCPPGGDMAAMEVAFSNVGTDGPWTVVKAGGANWPGADADGCNLGASTPAAFDWTLASGADGSRTVYARFKHSNDLMTASDSITVDTAAPVITDEGVDSGTVGANGWYTSSVVNKFSASDGTGSGITCTSPWTVSSGTGEGNAVTIPSGTCGDAAGNTASSINSAAFQIDLSNPSVEITSPTESASIAAATVTVTGTASDGISGIASVSVNNVTATGTASWSAANVPLDCGANSIVATVTDNAGRTGTHSVSVTRICNQTTYSAKFSQPLDMNGVLNKAKLGRVVPVKVEVFAETGGVTEEIRTGTVALATQAVNCTSGVMTDAVETYAAGSSNTGVNFRWDEAGDFFIYNLDTSKLPGASANKCYSVAITLNGNVIPGAAVQVQLTK